MNIAEEFEAALKSSGQTLPRQMSRLGLTLAKITNITDKEKLNRVKCLPIENENAEETDWCYVMAPLGGKGCGQFFFPSVGDLVVLAYLGGDPHRPMVIGACWNTETTPPYPIENGKTLNYSIKTPTGTEFLLYDEKSKQKATLKLPSGTVLKLDDEAQAVTIQDKSGGNMLKMDLKRGEITLKAKKKLTLSAGNAAVTLDSSGNIEEKASSKIVLKSANIEEKGSARVVVQGGTVQVKADTDLTLQASGPTSVKGIVVNIN